MRKFSVTAYDFYVCRIYAHFANSGKGELVDKLQEMNKRGLLRTVKMFLFTFLLMITLGIIGVINTENILIVALRTFVLPAFIIISLIRAFMNIWIARREYNHFNNSFINRPVTLRDKVAMYEITSEGIYINTYNKLQRSDMVLLPWDNISKCVVEHLYYSGNHEKENKYNMLRREIEAVQEHHPDFVCDAQITNEDYKTIVCETDSNLIHTYSYLPIPTQWTQDEVDVFLDEIRKYVDVEIEDYDPIHLEDVVVDTWNHIWTHVTKKNK